MASPFSPADADLSHEQPGQQQQQQQPAPDSAERELVDLLFHREPVQQFSIPQPPKHWNNTRRTAAGGPTAACMQDCLQAAGATVLLAVSVGILELVQLPLPRDPPAAQDSSDVKCGPTLGRGGAHTCHLPAQSTTRAGRAPAALGKTRGAVTPPSGSQQCWS